MCERQCNRFSEKLMAIHLLLLVLVIVAVLIAAVHR